MQQLNFGVASTLRIRPTTVLLFSLSLSVFACSNKKDNVEPAAKTTPTAKTAPVTAETPSQPGSTCEEQATELKAFLTTLSDANTQVAAPWPTGDAEADAWLAEIRPKLRETMKTADPDGPSTPLPDELNTSFEEELFRNCPEGLAAVQAIRTIAPAKRIAEGASMIADGVLACECKINIAQLKVGSYINARGLE